MTVVQSYYNRDTIESIRQGRGLTGVVDPSDALYTCVETSAPAPTSSHQRNRMDSADEDEILGNREDFLGGASKTSIGVTKATGEEDVPTETYYNVPHHTAESAEVDYYNSVGEIGGESDQPLLDPEDNQYIYVQNSDVPRTVSAPSTKPSVAVKPRHFSSPVGGVNTKKYVNLGPDQRQVLQEVAVKEQPTETSEEQLTNGGTEEGEPDQPLYVNFREDEVNEEDEGGKEIYENLVR